MKNFKILDKNDLFDIEKIKYLGFDIENYMKKWYVALNKNISINYHEKFSYYTCCFTGKQYRKHHSKQIEWCNNCIFFVKCPNYQCDNWIEYKWNYKRSFYENIQLINNFINCCDECNKNYDNPGLCCKCKNFNFKRDSMYRGKDICNCSNNYFLNHNNSDSMKEISKKNIQKALKWKFENPKEAKEISRRTIKIARETHLNQIKNNILNSLKENDINFGVNENFIKIKDILDGNFDNIPGVWAIWGLDKDRQEKCLTVGQSENIGKELRWTIRVLSNKKLNELGFKAGNWDHIQKYKVLEYRIICLNEKDFNKREQIEAIYAIKNNSLYWNPSPTQGSNKFIKNIKERVLV